MRSSNTNKFDFSPFSKSIDVEVKKCQTDPLYISLLRNESDLPKNGKSRFLGLLRYEANDSVQKVTCLNLNNWDTFLTISIPAC